MTSILILADLALLSWLVPARWRILSWLAISIGALYALQPPGPDFATITLILILGVWLLTHRDPLSASDRVTLGLGITIALSAALVNGAAGSLIVGLGLVAMSGTAVTALIPPLDGDSGLRKRLALVWIGALIAVFAVLKTPGLADHARVVLAEPGISAPPLTWFGFSYVAFRLIHILLDYRNGRLPELGLRDFALYVVFFPALTAGPIDRVQRFVPLLTADRPFETRWLLDGGQRIMWGLFRKFVVADSLASMALNPRLVAAAQGQPLALWLMVYAYAFQIFFDFAGYTDIAIGIGLLIGIKLPENFSRPYSRRNIALFWNNWHITLSTWYRDYVFMPLSRTLIKARWRPTIAALTVQVSTMILIGLWHGVSLNFALWGAWHGLGLYAHRRIVQATARRSAKQAGPARQFPGWIGTAASVALTFHFVALGWIWFALPDFHSSLITLAGLFGIRLTG